jgi:hypothetical protein
MLPTPYKSLKILSTPKTLFIIPTERLSALTLTMTPSELVRFYEKTVDSAYSHFSNDEIEVRRLNEALDKGNYRIPHDVYGGLCRRFNWMGIEMSAYDKFGVYASLMAEKSQKLEKSLEVVKLLTDVMKSDIRNAAAIIDRRVY